MKTEQKKRHAGLTKRIARSGKRFMYQRVALVLQ